MRIFNDQQRFATLVPWGSIIASVDTWKKSCTGVSASIYLALSVNTPTEVNICSRGHLSASVGWIFDCEQKFFWQCGFHTANFMEFVHPSWFVQLKCSTDCQVWGSSINTWSQWTGKAEASTLEVSELKMQCNVASAPLHHCLVQWWRWEFCNSNGNDGQSTCCKKRQWHCLVCCCSEAVCCDNVVWFVVAATIFVTTQFGLLLHCRWLWHNNTMLGSAMMQFGLLLQCHCLWCNNTTLGSVTVLFATVGSATMQFGLLLQCHCLCTNTVWSVVEVSLVVAVSLFMHWHSLVCCCSVTCSEAVCCDNVVWFVVTATLCVTTQFGLLLHCHWLWHNNPMLGSAMMQFGLLLQCHCWWCNNTTLGSVTVLFATVKTKLCISSQQCRSCQNTDIALTAKMKTVSLLICDATTHHWVLLLCCLSLWVPLLCCLSLCWVVQQCSLVHCCSVTVCASKQFGLLLQCHWLFQCHCVCIDTGWFVVAVSLFVTQQHNIGSQVNAVWFVVAMFLCVTQQCNIGFCCCAVCHHENEIAHF